MDNVKDSNNEVDKQPTELKSQDIEQQAHHASRFLRDKIYGLGIPLLTSMALLDPEIVRVGINLWDPPAAK